MVTRFRLPHRTFGAPRRQAAIVLLALTGLLVAACGDGAEPALPGGEELRHDRADQARGDSGCPDDIESPADFKGCTVGFKGVVQAEFLAMLNAHDIERSEIELISVGFNPVVLAEGQVDVYPVFQNNEPDILRRVIGAPVRVFTAADSGVPTLGVGYVATEDGLADPARQEAIRRFLLATMHGFEEARANPTAAIEDTRAFLTDEADLVHERFLLDTDLGNAVSDLTETNGLGWFTEQQVQDLHDVLLGFEGIPQPTDVASAIDRSLLESIYRDGELIALEAIDSTEQLSLRFMAGFRAQANLPFVAVYVAQQRGFFDAVGLDVDIRHSSGQGEHVRLLLSGDVDITTQPASEALQRRSDPGAPIVLVSLFGQTGNLGYAVLVDRK
jgi:ABC-type nitrate/sulfonate/bicarbonate transport system substrate-binding protein